MLGGGGYNPWTVARYWAGMWGRLSGKSFPDRLPQEATDMLASMECDLIDEDEIDEAWLTTIADERTNGPVRDEIVSLARQVTH